MKLLYKPFAIIAGFIGARVGKLAFRSIWSRIDDRQPPDASIDEAPLPKVIGAAALEAATMAAIAAAVDRGAARSFQYLTGFWPGEKHAESAD